MALSDLTGTTWRLNSSLTSYAGGSYTRKTYNVNITTETSLPINFEETATSFVVIEIGYDSGGEYNVVWLYTSTPVSYTNRGILASGNDTKSLPDTWNSRYENTFTITGGTDATNSVLIAWLEDNCENATPAPPAIPDIAISYAGENIVELSEAGTKTLKTAGKYLTDDIVLTYSPSGGGDSGGSTASITVSLSSMWMQQYVSWVDETGAFRTDLEEEVGDNDVVYKFYPAVGSMFVIVTTFAPPSSISQCTLERTHTLGTRPTNYVLIYMVTG